MLRIGLTGGIASGKSLVAGRLAELGAVVVDADVLARQVVEPGTDGLAAVVDRFGFGVLGPDGTLDRPALGRLVFADDAARADLEAIVHPRVRAAGEALERGTPSGAVVVHDIPLLVEKGYASGFHAVVVTQEELEERVRRMTSSRGLSESEARARIAAQASDERRLREADVVLPGGCTVEERLAQVDRLWVERLVPWAANIAARRGVRRDPAVVLAAPDPAWGLAAARQLRRLRGALDRAGLGVGLLGLDHIGSTSVPGLCAKPVLDLQVRVRDWSVGTGLPLREALASAGFFPRGSGAVLDDPHEVLDPDPAAWRKVLYLGSDPVQVYHLHVREHTGPGARLALLFRDYLRSVPSARHRYAAAKRRAAEDAPGGDERSRGDYTAAKAPWFESEVPAALAWARDAGWRGPGPG